MKRILCAMLALILLLSLVGCGNNTEDYEFSTTKADVFIKMPALRQNERYTSGPACVQMIMNYLEPHEYDEDMKQFEEELETDEDDGTTVESIIDYFDDNYVEYTEYRDISADKLKDLIKQKNIVLMCIQALSDDEEYNLTDAGEDDYLTEGHWVICVGYKKTDDTLVFFFNDPATVGHSVIEKSDLEERWIYKDTSGNVYKCYGIAIEINEDFDSSKTYYLK